MEQNPPDSPHIAWHPAFVEALQMELQAYQDALEFHPEYQLTSEPLRIDCVIRLVGVFKCDSEGKS